MCPDKKMSCQDNMTCCETESGSYDCCPLPNVRFLPKAAKVMFSQASVILFTWGDARMHPHPDAAWMHPLGAPQMHSPDAPPPRCTLPLLQHGCTSPAAERIHSPIAPLQQKTGGQYAYYWNAFLLLFNQFHSRRFCIQSRLEIIKSSVWYLSYFQAVCCSNRNQCCPSGYTCDTKQRTCIPSLTTVPWRGKIPGKPKSVKVGKECPGGKSSCQDNATCCVLPSGGYGCCPLPNVSIKYMLNFCGTPVNYKCEVSCEHWIYVKRSIALLEKYNK